MTLDPQDPKFAAAGLSVLVDGRTARVMDGEVEVAQVRVENGALVFLPGRSAKQRSVLKRIGALVD